MSSSSLLSALYGWAGKVHVPAVYLSPLHSYLAVVQDTMPKATSVVYPPSCQEYSGVQLNEPA